MITHFTKKTSPSFPGYIEEGSIPSRAVVSGSASLPVEIQITGSNNNTIPCGIDIVFCIDNSGSTDGTDPDKLRFSTIQRLIDEFSRTRDNIDRISIIVFEGDRSELIQGWSLWSETSDTISQLMDTGTGGSTPMACAMNNANELLYDTGGTYKLVILLTDGGAYPDDCYENPEQAIIGTPPYTPYDVRDSIVYDAWYHRIIYSTIYLEPTGTYDSFLLMEIAKRTDYITDYEALSDNPRYYFRIMSNPIIMLEAYKGLIDDLSNRGVPQNLEFTEIVNDKLIIDADAAISFGGDGFNVEQNVLDFGSPENLNLSEALEKFQATRIFKAKLNELNGNAYLRFSVKLNVEYFNQHPDEIPHGDSICMPIDVIDDNLDRSSYLKFKIANEGAPGSMTVNYPAPQAIVCFKKGLSVKKSLLQETKEGNIITKQSVKIDVTNTDLEKVTWVQLAEYPSGFVTSKAPKDDFNFEPIKLIMEHKIARLFASKIINTLNIPRWDYRMIRQIQNSVKHAVLEKYSFLTERKLDIDGYLKQFMFEESPHEKFELDNFWRTKNQRGFFILEENFPSLTSRSIEFKIKGASFVKAGDNTEVLPWYADALLPKPGKTSSMSWYDYDGSEGVEGVEPNPDFTQYATTVKKPDLYIETCFSNKDIYKLYDFYTKNYINNANWELINSTDIRPTIDREREQISANIVVHNCGETDGSGKVNATCIFLPLSAKDFTLENRVFKYTPCIPILAYGKENTGNILANNGSKNMRMKLRIDSSPFGDGAEVLRDVEIFEGVVITLTEISNCRGEVLTGNNKSIDISRLSMALPPRPPGPPIPPRR